MTGTQPAACCWHADAVGRTRGVPLTHPLLPVTSPRAGNGHGYGCTPLRGSLVVLGRNNPSLYAVNGRPVYVHLNGLAIVLLK